jgi:hypothetical protein
VRKKPKKRRAVIRDEDEDGEEGINESFEVVSNKDAFNSDDDEEVSWLLVSAVN